MKKLEFFQGGYDGVAFEIQDDLPVPEEVELRFFAPLRIASLRYVLTQEGVKNNEYYERYIYRPAESIHPKTGDQANSIIDYLKPFTSSQERARLKQEPGGPQP